MSEYCRYFRNILKYLLFAVAGTRCRSRIDAAGIFKKSLSHITTDLSQTTLGWPEYLSVPVMPSNFTSQYPSKFERKRTQRELFDGSL